METTEVCWNKQPNFVEKKIYISMHIIGVYDRQEMHILCNGF